MTGIIVDPNPDHTAVDSWAIVIGTQVVELISASYNFIATYVSQFDYAVDLTVGGQAQPAIGYIYDSGSDTFSAPVPSLAVAKQQNLSAFKSALQGYIESRYQIDTRLTLITLYLDAQNNSLTNRLAYLTQIFPYINAIIAYAASYTSSIEAMSDPATVLATVWDFSQISYPDPMISPIVAIGIPN